jgi:hypothetical protein
MRTKDAFGLTVLMVSAAFVATASTARAEVSVSYTIENTSTSSYLLRGWRLSTSAFEPQWQPYAELRLANLGPGMLTLNVLFSQPLTDGQVNTPREVDALAAYTVELGRVAVRSGYAVYVYPSMEPADQFHEAFVQASSAWRSPFGVYSGVAADLVRRMGYYAYAGMTHGVASGRYALATKLNVGVNDYDDADAFGETTFSLEDITLSTTGTISLGSSGLYLATSLAVARDGRRDHEITPWLGVAVGVTQ